MRIDTGCSKTFVLQLPKILAQVRFNYAYWLKHLVERLGSEVVRKVWKEAFNRYDLDLLKEILESGWTEYASEAFGNNEDRFRNLLGKYTGYEGKGISTNEIENMINQAPPVYQIGKLFPILFVQRETTTYEALHIYAHGTALLTEILIDEYGKQGELIAYDVLHAGRSELGRSMTGPAVDYFKMMNETPASPDIFTAGLDLEHVSQTKDHDITLVKRCEWARYFREKHPDVGYLVACSTDEAFARGFNEHLRLIRTSTLMEGGDHCDFHYYTIEQDS